MSNTTNLPPDEDLYWRLHGLSKILEGSGVIDESRHPDAYPTILDAMVFIRGQQPVVREPLTDEQLWANDEIMSLNADLGWHMDTIRMLTRVIERAHGIKGGQHGTDN